MLITSVLFKEKWTDLKRTSVQCRRLSILSGLAVPFYVSFKCVCVLEGHMCVCLCACKLCVFLCLCI